MNKNTDQKNIQNKSRFNIADIVILIVIVAVITALGLRIYNIFDTETEVCRVEVTFRVSDITAERISFPEKAKLYSAETNAEVGYIEKYTVSDMTVHIYNENGELVEAKIPGKKVITGTIVLNCEKTDKGFYLDSTKFLTAGEKLNLYTTTREMTFEILSIKEIIENTSASTSAITPLATR